MTYVLVTHAVVGGVMLLAARRFRRKAFLLGALPMLATLAYAATQWSSVVGAGDPVSERRTWVGALDLAVSTRLDAFGLLMVLVVAGIGVAVMAYGYGYFSDTTKAGRTAGLLVWFAGAMLGVVVADNVVFLYLSWELTSITSWLLIGIDHDDPRARGAALHALLVTAAGGLALLAGLVLLAQAAGTWSLSGILAHPPSGGAVPAALALVITGIVTKSAQYPAHGWLPAAMVAPTPISAYLHSATMVKAGVYLAARFAPVFAAVGGWRPAIVGIGLFTMLAGALRALRQHDLKLLLAMGTVSQLGFLVVLFGAGWAEATVAGAAMLVAHALFKAALFLVVGIVDHQAGTRDRRQMEGFGAGWNGVKVVTVLAAASMAGLPPLLGFVAKESAFEALLHHGAGGLLVLGGVVAGSALTLAYSIRFARPVLARPVHPSDAPPPPTGGFVAPALALAGLSLAFGIGAAPWLDPLVEEAAMALDPGVDAAGLAVWHGFGMPLLLSAVTVAAGLLVWLGRRPVARWQERLAPPLDAGRAFEGVVHAVNVSARRVTGVVQTGSLPVYVAVILLVTAGVPAFLFGTGVPWPGWPDAFDVPLQIPLAAVVVGAAAMAAAVRRRIAAAVLLGVVGYGVALLFVVQGAPDLALTQFAVETLLTVAFVLVLRFLPGHFERRRPAVGLPMRVAIATTVAAGTFFFALVAAGHRTAPPVGPQITDIALPEGHGRNVVNVVLVDVRALDTFGEISVLVVAALGVVALARVGRRGAEAVPPPPLLAPGGSPERAGEGRA